MLADISIIHFICEYKTTTEEAVELYLHQTNFLLPSVFCQEALWREETVKKKLAALQESVSNLMNSSNKIWTVSISVCKHRAVY